MNRKEVKNNKGRFKKNHTPWNKGLKELHLSPETEFKKGHVPAGTKEIGTELIRTHSTRGDKYIYVKIKNHIWEAKHRLVWQQAHGEIPPHHVVRFKNGNTLDCRLENLELISRQQYAIWTLTRMNPKQKEEIEKYPEIIELQKLKLELNREINKCLTA